MIHWIAKIFYKTYTKTHMPIFYTIAQKLWMSGEE